MAAENLTCECLLHRILTCCFNEAAANGRGKHGRKAHMWLWRILLQ